MCQGCTTGTESSTAKRRKLNISLSAMRGERRAPQELHNDVAANLWLLVGAASIFAMISVNPLTTLACLITLPVLAQLLWRNNEPPVLFVGLGFQWLQISTKVFWADFQGLDILTDFNQVDIGGAVWLSLVGLLLMAVTIRMVIHKLPPVRQDTLRIEAARYSLNNIFLMYLLVSFLSLFVFPLIYQIIPPLRTVAIALDGFKWVIFFILSYTVIVQRTRYDLLAIAICFEIILGFTGYFADFRTVFIILFISLLTTESRFILRQWFRAALVLSMLVLLAIFWSAIKMEHRAYISGYSANQAVIVTTEDKLNDIIDLAVSMNINKFNEGAGLLVARVGYVDLFAEAKFRVPRYMKHENGAIWWQALRHVMTPRILFPDKPVLDLEGRLVRKYTSKLESYIKTGTSVSLGYMAESYIDFGVPLMFVPIMLVGLMWGWIYRYFLSRQGELLLMYGFIMTYAEILMRYGFHSGKILGGVLSSFIVLALIYKFFSIGIISLLRKNIFK